MNEKITISRHQFQTMRSDLIALAMTVLGSWNGQAEPTAEHMRAFQVAVGYGDDAEITAACALLSEKMLGPGFKFEDAGEIAVGLDGRVVDLTCEWPEVRS